MGIEVILGVVIGVALAAYFLSKRAKNRM